MVRTWTGVDGDVRYDDANIEDTALIIKTIENNNARRDGTNSRPRYPMS